MQGLKHKERGELNKAKAPLVFTCNVTVDEEYVNLKILLRNLEIKFM